ncbi:MAG: hypothetical protein ACYTDX_04215 [Planctomycetota bacterium]|jgi:hypothetical protein
MRKRTLLTLFAAAVAGAFAVSTDNVFARGGGGRGGRGGGRGGRGGRGKGGDKEMTRKEMIEEVEKQMRESDRSTCLEEGSRKTFDAGRDKAQKAALNHQRREGEDARRAKDSKLEATR